METQSRNTITSLRIQTFTKLARERTHICVGLLALICISGVFLALIHYSLIFLQFPALVGIIMLIKSPSFSKALLTQQYLGITGLVFSVAKSLLFISYAVYYIVDYFQQSAKQANNPGKLTIREYDRELNIFPSMMSTNDATSSNVFAVILIVLFSLVMVLECGSTYTIGLILKKTYKIVSIIQRTDLNASTSASTGLNRQYSEAVTQLPPRQGSARLSRQDSAYNSLLPSLVDDALNNGRQSSIINQA